MGMTFYKPQGIWMTHVATIHKENEAYFLNRGKPIWVDLYKNYILARRAWPQLL